jgi:hypothetical protein
MDPWPAVVVVGFALATALVIVLARASTGRWERQRTVERRRRIARSMHRRRAAARTEVPAARRSTVRRRVGPHLPPLRRLGRTGRARPARRR